jgi:WD40 repeat protein
VVTGSSLDGLSLWDAATGVALRTFESSWAHALAVSRDGRLVAAGDEYELGLWDVATGVQRATCDVSADEHYLMSVDALAFSPDGKWIVADGIGRSTWLCPVDGKAEPRAFGDHRSSNANAVAFSPDGRLIARAQSDHLVTIWDAASGGLLHSLAGHAGEVTSLAFFPDGRRLVSGSEDQTVKLWSMDDFALEATLLPFGEEVVVMSSDGSLRLSRDGAKHLVAVEGTKWSAVSPGNLQVQAESGVGAR